MVGDSGLGGFLAALSGLALLIAIMITALCWFCIYGGEAHELNEYAVEPCTTFQLILDDIPLCQRK